MRHRILNTRRMFAKSEEFKADIFLNEKSVSEK